MYDICTSVQDQDSCVSQNPIVARFFPGLFSMSIGAADDGGAAGGFVNMFVCSKLSLGWDKM